jgi:hypothetical protein
VNSGALQQAQTFTWSTYGCGRDFRCAAVNQQIAQSAQRVSSQPAHVQPSASSNAPQVDEPQGEAICVDASSGGSFTLSEGRGQQLYYVAPR